VGGLLDEHVHEVVRWWGVNPRRNAGLCAASPRARFAHTASGIWRSGERGAGRGLGRQRKMVAPGVGPLQPHLDDPRLKKNCF